MAGREIIDLTGIEPRVIIDLTEEPGSDPDVPDWQHWEPEIVNLSDSETEVDTEVDTSDTDVDPYDE